MRRPGAGLLALVAAGGAAGAVLRAGLGALFPDHSGWPWTTFSINLVGCALLAGLPSLAARVAPSYRTGVAAALGPGLLGGFTTLSAYAEESRALLARGEPLLAGGYLAGTLAACLIAVHLVRLAAPAPSGVDDAALTAVEEA